jgi:molecular chaperone GrpE
MTHTESDPGGNRPTGGAAEPRHSHKGNAPGKAAGAEPAAAPDTEAKREQPAETPSDPAAQLAEARDEAAHAQDRFLRAVADLENYRRRVMREKEELRLGAGLRIIEDLLPVLDHLALGLQAARQSNADVNTLAGGVEMVLQQFKSALAKHGLVEINPLGCPFNPHEHEAISHQASADVAAEHVLAVVRSGFTLNGRLLRPAAVVVSSGPAPKEKKG